VRLLFQDETKLCLCPDRGADYHPVGHQTRVASPGRSVARWLFGSIDVATGEGLYQVYRHATSAEFLRHLDDLLQLFPAQQLLLVLDQASYHDSDAVRDFLAHVGGRLELIPLPTHSPHLNAVERLWGYLRDHVTRNVFWGTIARQCQTVCEFLRALDFPTFQRLMSTSPCLRTA
jgi:transposase